MRSSGRPSTTRLFANWSPANAEILAPTALAVLGRVRSTVPGVPGARLAVAQLTGPVIVQILLGPAPLGARQLRAHVDDLLIAWGGSAQACLQICDQIGDVLDTHREAYQVGGDLQREPATLAASCGADVDERLHAPQGLAQGEQLGPVAHPEAAGSPPPRS